MKDLVFMSREDLDAAIERAVKKALNEQVQPPELLTTAELAKQLQLSEKYVASWAKDGCPHIPTGRAFRWRLDDVLAWLGQRKAG